MYITVFDHVYESGLKIITKITTACKEHLIISCMSRLSKNRYKSAVIDGEPQWMPGRLCNMIIIMFKVFKKNKDLFDPYEVRFTTFLEIHKLTNAATPCGKI